MADDEKGGVGLWDKVHGVKVNGGGWIASDGSGFMGKFVFGYGISGRKLTRFEFCVNFQGTTSSYRNMKTFLPFITLCAIALSSIGCQTSYDAYGNPQTTIDPATAGAGALAAGVLGYAIKDRRDDRKARKRYDNYRDYRDDRRYYRKSRYYNDGGYWGGYY